MVLHHNQYVSDLKDVNVIKVANISGGYPIFSTTSTMLQPKRCQGHTVTQAQATTD